ncbi:MAG: 4Fe-4S binding protein [Candidatus Heimdallarchaeota archaeon]|nr:4Fe-4S binding protein [Candidatus Heimdallarchaeota archaeon]MDH5644911.1 4Fe-4S binding protein [Candidatus Heimdallarchaeota archaeon]
MSTRNKELTLKDKFSNTILNKRIRLIRLVSQLTFFFLLNGVIIGLSKIPFPAPVSLPAGSPFATVWGGFDAMQYILSKGQFPFLALGVFFITASLTGRFACGWICSIGLWQDILSFFPLKKAKLDKPTNLGLQDIGKIFMWSSLLFTAWIGTQRPDVVDGLWTTIPYGVIDPAGTIMVTWFYVFFWDYLPGEISLLDTLDQLGPLFFWKSLVLILISFASFKVPRFYCRFVCPTGALLGYVSPNSLLTIKRNPLKCSDGCQKCEDACPMGVPILDEDPEGISNSLCINCGNCIDACSEAMSFKIRV